MDNDRTRPGYRRNIVALVTDSTLFYMAMSFIGTTTVLPALLGTLTDSKLVIGVGSGITRGAWLLPQLLVAGMVAGLTHRKRVIVGAAWASRPLLLVAGLIIWRYAIPSPALTLALVLGILFVFFVMDAVVSVPWMDHLARTVSPKGRGTVIGLGQVLGGLGGIGTGGIVRYLLSENSPWGYPANYALVYAAGGIVFLLSAVAISFISNPDCTPEENQKALSLKETMASLPRIVSGDAPFRRLIAVQLLVGFAGVANAFFILYATSELGFPLRDTGLFVSAQVTGSMIAGFLLGFIQSRWGPLAHIRLQIVLASAAPLLALAAGLGGLSAEAVRWIYLGLYLMLGVYIGGAGWPFFNWLFEYAAESQRPLYVGLTNTLGAITMLAPVLGGLVVDFISYPAVFTLAVVFSSSALLLSLGLPSTRHAADALGQEIPEATAGQVVP